MEFFIPKIFTILLTFKSIKYTCLLKLIEITINNNKNKSTKMKKEPNIVLVTDALDAFNLLLKVGIKRGKNIPEISTKSGISAQAIYRYKSDYKSQKKVYPTVNTLSKLAGALGYDLALIKRENQDVEN